MRRGFLAAFLFFGAIGSYTAGFYHLSGRADGMREAHERHLAQICADAARRQAESPAPAVAP